MSGLSAADAAKFVSDASTADALAVAAKNATEIRGFAFVDCYGLITADFPKATKIGEGAFTLISPKTDDNGKYISPTLKSVNLPAATEIGKGAFAYNISLTSVNCSAAISIGSSAFNGCTALESINLPAATKIGTSFVNCTNLRSVDLPNAIALGDASYSDGTFENCAALTALILRSTDQVCDVETKTKDDVVKNTPIESGTGYIYVPSALLDSYKTATNWSTYANQFRALEDYTVDGTTTGELDSTKI